MHAYLIIFSFIIEYSAMHVLPKAWVSPAIASQQQYQSTSRWQPTAIVQEALTLSAATGSCGFMYFICSVYTDTTKLAAKLRQKQKLK